MKANQFDKKFDNGEDITKYLDMKKAKRPESEIKIARFVDIEACKSIFSEHSTFVLRSPEYYRRLYETSYGKYGDRNEGCAHKADGGTAEYDSFVTSCWTILKGNEPTANEWNIFKERDSNIVAIISTPSKVCKFLDTVLATQRERENRKFPFWPVKHSGVTYEPANHIDHTNIFKVVPFAKNKEFINENEYRFVLEYAEYPCLIDSFVFCGGIDYIEYCLINPQINEDNRHKLRCYIGNAFAGYFDFADKKMGDIITNSDILFP